MALDLRTVMLLNTVINVISVVAIAILWHQYRKHFSGIGFRLLNMILQTAGIFLISLRGYMTSFMQ